MSYTSPEFFIIACVNYASRSSLTTSQAISVAQYGRCLALLQAIGIKRKHEGEGGTTFSEELPSSSRGLSRNWPLESMASSPASGRN
jgi:hypothetical protein